MTDVEVTSFAKYLLQMEARVDVDELLRQMSASKLTCLETGSGLTLQGVFRMEPDAEAGHVYLDLYGSGEAACRGAWVFPRGGGRFLVRGPASKFRSDDLIEINTRADGVSDAVCHVLLAGL